MKNFKKHKEIRKKLKSAIKKGTLGLIDIGSSKIVCIIIKFSEIFNYCFCSVTFLNTILFANLKSITENLFEEIR